MADFSVIWLIFVKLWRKCDIKILKLLTIRSQTVYYNARFVKTNRRRKREWSARLVRITQKLTYQEQDHILFSTRSASQATDATSILLMINDLQETDFESILTHLGGVSKIVLIKMLRELEADRMIKKITFGSFGSSDYKVGYSLTLTGEQIIPILNSMND